MANSMNTILVRYSGSENPISIQDFLAKGPKELTETEQKIQEATRLVYELNGKEPPLYHKFPTFRSEKQPLTMDTTTAGNTDHSCAAAFEVNDNKVIFQIVDNPNLLVNTIAHELKHAEQCDEEVYRKSLIFKGFSVDNAYAQHQLEFLNEAQAFTTGARAYYEIYGNSSIYYNSPTLYGEISKKYTDASGKKDYPKIEKEMIKVLLDILYTRKAYKDKYDTDYPIGDNDKGIDKIPDAYHLSQDLLEDLKKVPKSAFSFNGRIWQAAKNNHWDDIILLCQNAIQNDEKINKSSLFSPLHKMLKEASPQQIQKLLDLKENDDKYVVSDQLIHYTFEKIKDPALLAYFISVTRDEKTVIDKETLIHALCNSVNDQTQFQNLVKIIENEQGNLPFVSSDLTERNNNILLNEFRFSSSSLIPQMLPLITKLKGQDGNSLITPETLIKNFGQWCTKLRDPNDIQAMFDSIKDEKGNLPFSRKMFDTNEGQNFLLEEMKFSFFSKGNSVEKLPILMALKDKDGKPIISQENIDKFPEHNPLTSAVKAYKRTGIQQCLKAQAKAGAKSLETELKGYVKKRPKTTSKSPKAPSPKINPSKGDFSL